MTDIPPVEFQPLLLGDTLKFTLPVGMAYELQIWYNTVKQEGKISGCPALEKLTDMIWEYITTPAYRQAINALYHQRMEEQNPLAAIHKALTGHDHTVNPEDFNESSE